MSGEGDLMSGEGDLMSGEGEGGARLADAEGVVSADTACELRLGLRTSLCMRPI